MSCSPSTTGTWLNMAERIPTLVWALGLIAALSGCFEEGEPGPINADGAVGVDTATPPDTSPVDGRVGSGTPCLTDLDCASMNTTLCGPFVVCGPTFVCAPEPTTVVDCSSTDPCLEGTCNPATGACVYEDTCKCEMAASTLACGGSVSWAASDPEPPLTQVDGVACGAPYGQGAKRAWRFTAASSEPVTIRASGGAIDSLSVLVSPQGGCEPTACMARAQSAVAFVPAQGATYAVVVEHVDPIAVDSFELSVSCGATMIESDCQDGLDEDFDGATDCSDVDCLGLGGCAAAFENDCADGVDDDANGLTDCEDAYCTVAVPCLQACQEQMAVSCGFSQGLTTGGGKANATDYNCGPAASGKEVVYGFKTTEPKIVHAKSGAFTGGIYVMKSPPGDDLCSPKYCEIYGPTEAYFIANANQQYYIAIDGPAGQDVSFEFEVESYDM